MIKINLLPKTINKKAILRNTAMIFGAVLIVIIVGGIMYGSSIKAKVTEMEAMATETENYKAKVEGIQKQATDLLASIDPMKKKLDFINAVMEYNTKYPALYAEVARCTYPRVEYTSILCDGTKVEITGRTKNLDDFGRYLLTMYRATSLFSEVTVASVGGGSLGQIGSPGAGSQSAMAGGSLEAKRMSWLSFSMSCKLTEKKQIVAPAFGGTSGAQPAAGAAPAMPAMPVLPSQTN